MKIRIEDDFDSDLESKYKSIDNDTVIIVKKIHHKNKYKNKIPIDLPTLTSFFPFFLAIIEAPPTIHIIT